MGQDIIIIFFFYKGIKEKKSINLKKEVKKQGVRQEIIDSGGNGSRQKGA